MQATLAVKPNKFQTMSLGHSNIHCQYGGLIAIFRTSKGNGNWFEKPGS